MNDDRGFFETLLGVGRPLIKLIALALMGAGAFAVFQAATGQFLPQDTDYLGLTAHQLCTLRGCRVVHFMIHDRISFGGVLLAIGVMYLWLAEFPLKRGESWLLPIAVSTYTIRKTPFPPSRKPSDWARISSRWTSVPRQMASWF